MDEIFAVIPLCGEKELFSYWAYDDNYYKKEEMCEGLRSTKTLE